MKERKIALVGTAGSGKRAPFHDKTWEIWGVSGRADYVTRADRWYELHRLDGEPEDWANNWRHNLSSFAKDIPELVMMYPEPALHKNVVQYPHDRICERFGTRFMTSTFSWMMADAIDQLRPVDGKPVAGRIAIFGVDMEHGTEYRQQRAGFFHFIWLAHFAGIPVERLVDGGLAYEPVPYPMWQDDPLLAKNALRRKDSLDQLNEWDETRNRLHILMNHNRGALEEAGIAKKLGRKYDPDARKDKLDKEYSGIQRSVRQLDEDILAKRGQFEEQCWLDDFLQP